MVLLSDKHPIDLTIGQELPPTFHYAWVILEIPAVGLSQGYLLMKNYLETYLAAAERGMTIQTPDGTIDKSNAHQYRERYEARLAVYRSAIEQRGYESFAGNYEARSTESCSRAGSAWAGTVAQGSVRGVGIEQDGFTIRLTTNFELDGELRDVEMESRGGPHRLDS